MALSPCPRCQQKKQFDTIPTSALGRAGFVVQHGRDNPTYRCNKSQEHVWYSLELLRRELSRAGY